MYVCDNYYYFLWPCSPAQDMVSSFTRVLDHTPRRAPVGRTPPEKWSARRRDLYLITHNTHNRQTSMSPVGFEPTIATRTGRVCDNISLNYDIFQPEIVEKTNIHFILYIFCVRYLFFTTIAPFIRYCGKMWRAKQATNVIMTYALWIPDNRSYKHTLRIRNTYLFRWKHWLHLRALMLRL
jgi:hypothetical protein